MDKIEEKEKQEDKILDTYGVKAASGDIWTQRRGQLIYLRYFADRTQSDVGKLMGISQVQVSRMEKRIMENLEKAGRMNNSKKNRQTTH